MKRDERAWDTFESGDKFAWLLIKTIAADNAHSLLLVSVRYNMSVAWVAKENEWGSSSGWYNLLVSMKSIYKIQCIYKIQKYSCNSKVSLGCKSICSVQEHSWVSARQSISRIVSEVICKIKKYLQVKNNACIYTKILTAKHTRSPSDTKVSFN